VKRFPGPTHFLHVLFILPIAFQLASASPLSSSSGTPSVVNIKFPQGKSAVLWEGYVQQDVVFKVYLDKGKRLSVEGGGPFTMSLSTPSGRIISCLHPRPGDLGTVCRMLSTEPLPETGVYTVNVLYQMGGYADGRNVRTMLILDD
jgi:hypothetical protein